MKVLRVKIDYDHAKWIKELPRPIVEARASDANEAAELASGVRPQTKRHACEHQAQSWPLDDLRRAHEIAHLYAVGSFKISLVMAAVGALSISWATRAAFNSVQCPAVHGSRPTR
jgi:hypothetical protein